uniref:Uncharacterized protein n=1 Tax=Oryza meridionalis TaxID=40149 RepID=A0A0E0EII5_9ORYZ
MDHALDQLVLQWMI